MYDMMDHGMYGYGGIFMMIFGLLLLIGIVLIIVRLFRHSSLGYDRNETHMDVLKKRYARGEIDKEEFEQKKRDMM